MAERQRTEISAELLDRVREIAERRGIPVEEVMEEAVRGYLAFRDEGTSVIREPAMAYGVLHGPEGEIVRRDPFLALLDRMDSRFDYDEDEAERIAVEEQHAWRRERRERAGREGAER